MRGGDNMAGFYVNGPKGETIMPYQWKQHAEIDDSTVPQSGNYHFFEIYSNFIF